MCSTCLRTGESNAICAFKSNPMFFYQRQVKTQTTNIYTNLVLLFHAQGRRNALTKSQFTFKKMLNFAASHKVQPQCIFLFAMYFKVGSEIFSIITVSFSQIVKKFV